MKFSGFNTTEKVGIGVGTSVPEKDLTVQSATSPAIGLYSTYADTNSRNWAINTNNSAYGDFTISTSAARLGNPTTIKMSILKDGKVGIGTTTQSHHLQMDVASGNVNFFAIRQADYILWSMGLKASDTKLYFRSGNPGAETDHVTFQIDGKVGIGTTSPAYNLHIKPASGNARLKLESDSNTADVEMMLDSASSTRNAHITFYNAGTQKGGVGYVSSDTIMKMWGGNNPADDHLCINSSGSVGIGTPSPSVGLEVAKTSADASFKVNRTDQTNIQLIAAGSSYVRASAALILQSNGANNRLTLAADGSSTFAGTLIVNGTLTGTSATLSGVLNFNNGSDNCFRIEADSGKDTYINSYGSGNFIQFKQNGAAVLSLYQTYLAIPDSTQLRFGASSDLRIYHDGSNSRITNATGSLWLQSDTGIRLTNLAVTESMAAFYHNAAVELYYDGTKKLETTSAGVTFTGTGTFSTAVAVGDAYIYTNYIRSSNLRVTDNGYLGSQSVPSVIQIQGDGDVAIGYPTTINSSLKATTILDSSNSAGTNGQVLVSTGAAIDWKTLSEISGVDGTGTAGYLSKWTDADTIGNSVIVESSSKIGIGTATPAEKLDVNGNIMTTGASTNTGYDRYLKLYGNTQPASNPHRWAGMAVYNNGGNNVNALAFFTGTGDSARTEKVRIHNDGNVGIGTTAPAKLLHVEGSNPQIRLKASDATDAIINIDAGASKDAYLTFSQNGSAKWAVVHDYAGTDKLSIYNYANNANTVTFLPDGKVGIGTASPNPFGWADKALTIHDSSGTNKYVAVEILGKGTGGGAVLFGTDTLLRASIYGGNTSYLSFSTNANNSGSSMTEKMRILSDGKIGIGTTAPVSPLHVQQAAGGNYTGEARIGGVNTTHGMLLSYTQAGNTEGSIHVAPGYTNANALFKLRCSNGSTNQLVLKGDGKVGIGTSSPSRILTINDATLPCVQLCNGQTGTATGDGYQMQLSGVTGYLFNYDGQIIFGTSATVALTLDTSQNATFNGLIKAGNLSISGQEIDVSSGDLTLDVAGTIKLDSDNGTFYFQDGGTIFGIIEKSGTSMRFRSGEQDGDMIFMGNDGGTNITALTLDMSAGGNAIFNDLIKTGNLSISGQEIDVSSGDLTLDVAGDILLDAATGYVKLKDSGTEFGRIYESGSRLVIESMISNADFLFSGNNNGTGFTALTLDMSDAGTAIFNHDIKLAALPSTTVNAAVPILFRPTEGTLSGDTALTWNPAADSLDVNGTVITSNHIRSSGANSLKLGSANGGIIMYLTATGRVGIGTDSPGAKLEIDAGGTTDILLGVISDSTTYNAISLNGVITDVGKLGLAGGGGGNTNLYYDVPSTGKHIFRVATSDKVVFDTNGNVGIGITNPTRTLQVAGAAHATSHLVGSLTTALGIAGSFPDANDSELGPGYLVMTRDDTGAAKQLQFWKNGSLHSGVMTDTNGLNFVGSDGAADVTIKTDGDVGIGTANPTQQLMVWEGSSSVSLGEYSNGAVIWLDGVNGDLSGGDYFNIWADGNSALRFGYGTGQKVSMLSSGRFGIGVDTPSNLLSVEGSVSGDYLAEFKQGHSTAGQSYGVNITAGTNASDQAFRVANQAESTLLQVCGNGEIRVAGQTLVDNTNTNYKMTFPDNSGIAMGSAYTFANVYGSGGNLYLKANAYGANLGANPSKIYLGTAGNSGSTAPYVVVKGGIVGIGTDAPDSLGLNIASASTDPTASYTGNSQLVIGLVGSTTHKLAISRDTDGDNAYIHSYQDGVGAKNLILQPGGGKVGIGTITPGSVLEVRGATETIPNLGTYGTFFNLRRTDGHIGLSIGIDSSTNHFWFQAQNSTSPIAQALILNPKGGNVGIGVTSPSSKFTVVGSGSNGTYLGYIYNNGTESGDHGLNVQVATSGAGAYGLRVNTGGDTNALAVMGDGKVGMGTYTPDAKLHLYGTGIANTPTLAIENTTAGTFIHSVESFSPNMTSGQTNIIVVGRAGSTKNSGYIGYKYSSAGSDDNLLSLGHWGSNHLVNIQGDGNVGIGATDVSELLSVMPSTGDAGLAIYQSGSNVNNYDCRLKFQQDSGWQIEAPKFSENSNSSYDFGINYNRNQYAGDFYIANNGTKRIKVDSSGHLLPGANGTYNLGSSGAYWKNAYLEDTAINGTLYVGGALTTNNSIIIPNASYYFGAKNTSGTGIPLMVLNGSNAMVLGGTSMATNAYPIRNIAKYITFEPAGGLGTGIETMRITNASFAGVGSVGIGTSVPSAMLHVYGGGITISNDQILQIGTTNGNDGKIRFYGNSGTAYYMDYQPVGTNDREFRWFGSTSSSAYTTYFNQNHESGGHNVYVDGTFTATGTKNFEIDHPTKAGMKLVHSSLEGPEVGVYYRGRAQSGTITLPDYWVGLVRDGTVTVQLTPNGSFQHLYVVSTSLTEIKIGAASGETIDCYYVIYGERANVDRLIVEKYSDGDGKIV